MSATSVARCVSTGALRRAQAHASGARALQRFPRQVSCRFAWRRTSAQLLARGSTASATSTAATTVAAATQDASGEKEEGKSSSGYFLYKFDDEGEIVEVVDSSNPSAASSLSAEVEPQGNYSSVQPVHYDFHEGFEPEQMVKEAVQPTMEKVIKSLRPKVPQFHEGIIAEELVKEAVQDNLDKQTRSTRPKVPKMDGAIGSAETQVKAAVQENLDKQVKDTRPKVPKLHEGKSAEEMVKNSVQSTLDKIQAPVPVTEAPAQSATEEEETVSEAIDAVEEQTSDVTAEPQEQKSENDSDSTSLPALSRMRKAELIAECEARGVSNEGTVSDLRGRLREARSADGA